VLIVSVHFCVGRKDGPATFRRLLDSCMEVPTYLTTWTMDDLELSVRQGEPGNSVLRDRFVSGYSSFVRTPEESRASCGHNVRVPDNLTSAISLGSLRCVIFIFIGTTDSTYSSLTAWTG
jgi:hypothetical protein